MAHVSRFDLSTQSFLSASQASLVHAGYSSVQATQMAYGRLYGMVSREASTLGYVDVIRGFGYAAVLMLPLVLLLKKPRPAPSPRTDPELLDGGNPGRRGSRWAG